MKFLGFSAYEELGDGFGGPDCKEHPLEQEDYQLVARNGDGRAKLSRWAWGYLENGWGGYPEAGLEEWWRLR